MYTNAGLITFGSQQGDIDILAYLDGFTWFPREYEHDPTPMGPGLGLYGQSDTT